MVVSGLQPQRPPKWVRAAMLREPPDDRKGSLADRATGDSAPAQPSRQALIAASYLPGNSRPQTFCTLAEATRL